MDVFGFGAQWGYQSDAETGLLLLTNRYYDPGLARFLTRDPIGQAGGLNLYQYVGNGPTYGADPSGLVPYLGQDEQGRYIYAPGYTGPITMLRNPAPESISEREYLGRLALAAMVHSAPVSLMPGLSECEETALENDLAIGFSQAFEAGMAEEQDDLVDVYRGVAADHPGYYDALDGNAYPRGGPASDIDHVRGNTESPFTSWTLERRVAVRFAGEDGVVLHDRVPASDLIRPRIRYLDEFEVLRRGPVEGAEPTEP